MFVLSSSLRIPDLYLLLENPRPLSPWGLPNFLSTCLGIDSLSISSVHPSSVSHSCLLLPLNIYFLVVLDSQAQAVVVPPSFLTL